MTGAGVAAVGPARNSMPAALAAELLLPGAAPRWLTSGLVTGASPRTGAAPHRAVTGVASQASHTGLTDAGPPRLAVGRSALGVRQPYAQRAGGRQRPCLHPGLQSALLPQGLQSHKITPAPGPATVRLSTAVRTCTAGLGGPSILLGAFSTTRAIPAA